MIQESEMTLTFPMKKQKYMPKVIADNSVNKIFDGMTDTIKTNDKTNIN